jgi:hypothetical protein
MLSQNESFCWCVRFLKSTFCKASNISLTSNTAQYNPKNYYQQIKAVTDRSSQNKRLNLLIHLNLVSRGELENPLRSKALEVNLTRFLYGPMSLTIESWTAKIP